ncbi:hypothetical protein HPB50_010586 [Hyalomma asiaticum]|uniref:Uncharacterized protein n=1 Tax=Hyalomma asiaticum TaxID=266040 RepID=A0ACB7RNH6_HYAAI|nr:hypothetical protein HPB50_010586 [Hyalomma asiaticum]
MACSRGWIVVAAASTINLFTLALMRSGAIVYVGIANTFDVSREDAAWPMCLTTVFNLVMGPITGILAQYFQISTLLVVGCLLASFPVGASYFSNGVPFLIVSLGVIHGCGLSLLTLGYAAVNQSVATNKALASGITIGGSVVGGIIFPPVIQYLFDEYGTKGGFLVFSAVMLNSTVAALFTRTPWRQTTAPRTLEKSMQVSSKSAVGSVANVPVYEANGEVRTVGGNDCSHVDSTSLSFCNGTGDLATHVECSEFTRVPTLETTLDAADCHSWEKVSPQNTLAKWMSFLKNPMFYIVAYTLGQVWYLNTTLLTVVVDYAVDCGIPKWNAVSLVTVITASDLVSRFVSGPITDKGILRKSTMMAMCLTVNGVAHALLPHFASYAALAVLSAVSGSSNGVAVTHIFVLCAELVDPAVFSVCLGAANFVAAFALLERPLMIERPSGPNADPCSVLPSEGHYCKSSYGSFRFLYDSDGKTCQLFWYRGCGGTQNNFRSYYTCLKRCAGKYLDENAGKF